MSTRDPIDPEAFGGDEYRRDGDVTSTERAAQEALEASGTIDARLSDRPVAPEDVAGIVALDAANASLRPLTRKGSCVPPPSPQDVDLGAEMRDEEPVTINPNMAFAIEPLTFARQRRTALHAALDGNTDLAVRWVDRQGEMLLALVVELSENEKRIDKALQSFLADIERPSEWPSNKEILGALRAELDRRRDNWQRVVAERDAALLELDALKRSATVPPTPLTALPVDAMAALRQEVMRELSAGLERVAPWLYEPVGALLPFVCPWCNEQAAHLFGIPYRVSKKLKMQRWRCVRCGGTSNTTLCPQDGDGA